MPDLVAHSDVNDDRSYVINNHRIDANSVHMKLGLHEKVVEWMYTLDAAE